MDRQMVGGGVEVRDVEKLGYLKKLKTMKKKFFVLRTGSESGPARLEYYDSEKKFRNFAPPKRSIILKHCFNINKKSDAKQKYAIALYTKDDCFSIITDSEVQQTEWLELLLELQNELMDGDEPRQHFDNVWQVTIKPRGLGSMRSMTGHYRLCMSAYGISLVKVAADSAEANFQFSSIRRCGHSEHYFFMEVGRSAVTGAGEIWMQVDDNIIAHNMHDAILSAMKNAGSASIDAEFFRNRSNSSGQMGNMTKPSGIAYDDNHDTVDAGIIRSQTISASHRHSPHFPLSHGERTRPQSMFHGNAPNVMASPIGNLDQYPFQGHRFRSDSAESRGTSSSFSADDSSPVEQSLSSYMANRAMTPDSVAQSIREELPDYLDMSTPSTPKDHDSSSVSSQSGIKEDGYFDMTAGVGSQSGIKEDGYFDMTPGVSSQSGTPGVSNTPLTSSKSESGYMDMSPGSDGNHPYLNVDCSRHPLASSPIPIHTPEPGYLDMTPGLATVKEGNSPEGYLLMAPGSQSPKSTSLLRPARAISYLSDDSVTNEPPKRAYSVGSKPPSKPINKHHIHVDHPSRQSLLDPSKSSSAPHLMPTRGKLYHGESPLAASSPLSASYKSDTDSFMELEFSRPRTASESFQYRPRSSSFGKSVISQQGHRPRSSSHSQPKRPNKSKMGSFESVRLTSQELFRKASQESLKSSVDSLQDATHESMKKLPEDIHQMTSRLSSDYLDMSIEPNKSPQPSRNISPMVTRKGASGDSYVDMNVGAERQSTPTSTRRTLPHKSVSPSVKVSSVSSSVKVNVIGDDGKHLPTFGSGKSLFTINKPTFHIKNGGTAISDYDDGYADMEIGSTNMPVTTTSSSKPSHSSMTDSHALRQESQPSTPNRSDSLSEVVTTSKTSPRQPSSCASHMLDNTTSHSHTPGNTSGPHTTVSTSHSHTPGNMSGPHTTVSTSQSHTPGNMSGPHTLVNTSRPYTPGNASGPHTMVSTSYSHTLGNTSRPHTTVSTSHSHPPGNTSRSHTTVSTSHSHPPGNTSRSHTTVSTSCSHLPANTSEPHTTVGTSHTHTSVNTSSTQSAQQHLIAKSTPMRPVPVVGKATATDKSISSITVNLIDEESNAYVSYSPSPKVEIAPKSSTNVHHGKAASSGQKNYGKEQQKSSIVESFKKDSEKTHPSVSSSESRLKSSQLLKSSSPVSPKVSSSTSEAPSPVSPKVSSLLTDFFPMTFPTIEEKEALKHGEDEPPMEKNKSIKPEGTRVLSRTKEEKENCSEVVLKPLDSGKEIGSKRKKTRSASGPASVGSSVTSSSMLSADKHSLENSTAKTRRELITGIKPSSQSRSLSESGKSVGAAAGNSRQQVSPESAKIEPIKCLITTGPPAKLNVPGMRKLASSPNFSAVGGEKKSVSPKNGVKGMDSEPRSRHSFTEASAYEVMTLTSTHLGTSQSSSSLNTEKELNYAALDLGSSEAVSAVESCVRPLAKSRHTSDEADNHPMSYAEIDFEKSESLKEALATCDVKFSL